MTSTSPNQFAVQRPVKRALIVVFYEVLQEYLPSQLVLIHLHHS